MHQGWAINFKHCHSHIEKISPFLFHFGRIKKSVKVQMHVNDLRDPLHVSFVSFTDDTKLF